MKIGIDAHAAEREGSGNCTYISNLLLALKEIDDKNEYILYATDKNHTFYDNFNGCLNFKIKSLPVRNPFFRIPFFLARQTYKDSLDILHVQYNAPPFHKGKLVVTIHDLGFLHMPETFSRSEAMRLKILTKFTANKSEKIITGSEYSRNDIIRFYGIDEKKIIVIPYGVSQDFDLNKDSQKTLGVLKKYNIPEKYMLNVGRLNPRKNFTSLVQAFNRLKKRHPLPHKLVIVGIEDYNTSQILRSIKKIDKGDVLFIGFVAKEDLPYIYSQAEVFIYPSLFEGVGLPILEAMRSGVPVVTSNTTSLQEIVKDAAMTLDPLDVEALSQAMWTLMSDNQLRENHIRKGLLRSQDFSWEMMAHRMVEIYENILPINI